MLWQEIVRRESTKFGTDLEHIINLTEVQIIYLSSFSKEQRLNQDTWPTLYFVSQD